MRFSYQESNNNGSFFGEIPRSFNSEKRTCLTDPVWLT